MAARRRISVASWDHDRAIPILAGDVPIPGYDVDPHILPTGQLFPIAVQEARFDVTELSIASHVLMVSRGQAAYTAVPVFLSRAFRHNGFFRRAGIGIKTPADFRGRVVGVPEYQMTAALWMRGIMADEYSVAASEVRWRTGALDHGIRHERLPLKLPEHLSIDPIKDGETLQDLLLAGEIDGLLAPSPPRAFLAGDPRIERVFPDFETAERDYHRRTGFFPVMHVLAIRNRLVEEDPDLPDVHHRKEPGPVMHVLAIRNRLVEEDPDLPRLLFDAFTRARDIAMARLREVAFGSANRLSLPWLNAAMERTFGALGEDYWPYGFAAARAEIATVCRYAHEQHLAARDVSPDELFHPSVLDS